MTTFKNESWQYAVLWEFEVRPGMENGFEAMYGSGGGWAALFRQDEAYLGTELIRDVRNPNRYVTVDLWLSREKYEDFLRGHKEEYKAIDRDCEALTLREREIGSFARAGKPGYL